MHILRSTLGGLTGMVLIGQLSGSLMAGAQSTDKPTGRQTMPMPGQTTMSKSMSNAMTSEQKIANAMSAAPSSISGKATILDWPAKEGDNPPVLRKGTNGWSCFPDMPDTEGNDPACLDAMWMKWVEAYMAKKAPHISAVGIGYMIAPGGSSGSNTDPFAMTATADNQWAHHAPHMMILVPDLKALESLPTDPQNGGPYVMYKGTPYAHIMAPVATTMMMKH